MSDIGGMYTEISGVHHTCITSQHYLCMFTVVYCGSPVLTTVVPDPE